MSAPDSPPPYDALAFDCDSTLSSLEGIDELARGSGPERLAQVEALTNAAMAGDVPLEEVYGRRLALLAPTRSAVAAVGQRYVETLVRNAAPLCAALAALGKPVHVVSGGLEPAVAHVARHLGVPAERVHAVPIRFDAQGAYAGFDERSPLARAGGKIDVLAAIAGRHGRVAHVGDGTTDLEVRPVVARFVGFGGVADRAAVRAGAARFVAADDLAAVAAELLAPDELERLAAAPEHAALARAVRAFGEAFGEDRP